MDSKRLVQYCYAYANNRKGESPTILDVRKLSSVTDFFFIVTGTSAPHIRAISDEVVDQFKKDHDVRPRSIDGRLTATWVAIDYNDVIVHILTRDMRDRYDLESLWGDAPRLKPRRPRGLGKHTATLVSVR
ncbi:MAG: Ribosomal silencing factor RsfS [Verrucomicrobia subdivision 3 bacterium]|nr:Ribosomal silencing factor RsfS [Limisphaerales bacterium]MCS1417724.1 Ribosomal silencing factor RsfS [Limisphaerales bacterium]